MATHSIFQRHPLLFAQALGWITYVIIDYGDHLVGGVTYAVPSFLTGLAAYILTGTVAIIANATRHKKIASRIFIFVTSLYSGCLLWNQIWGAAHSTTPEILPKLLQIFDQPIASWIGTGYDAPLLFLSWAGFYVGSKMFIANKQQEADLQLAMLDTKKAQLRTLRYQLNPHFLFNSLNSIDVSVQSDDKETALKMTRHLTSFLRLSLEQGELDKIPFEKELALVRDYITIEELRFGDAIKLTFDIADECLPVMVPPMFLQPLVENALKFAWNQKEQGKVDIKAAKAGGCICVEIVNSKTDAANSLAGTGTGLRNTRERLNLLYGNDATIHTEELESEYRLQLKFPWEVSIA